MRQRAQHIITIVLLVALAALAVWATGRYTWEADWTAGNRNSLTEPSRRVLDAMPDKITFTAYAYPGPNRQPIRDQIDRYRRYDDQVELVFVDPAKNPRKMRELGIRRSGEVRVAYKDRTETLDNLNEQTVTNALQRLSTAGEQWVVFLTGHGERDPQSDGESGYATLRTELSNQGLKVRTLNLAESPKVPDNTSVLVIASPQQGLLPGEVEIVRDYVANGGNLLWLDDPGQRYGLTPLADDLSLEWLEGTVVYPDFRELGTGHPAIALVLGYPKHPITERMSGLTVYPFAGALEAGKNKEKPGAWQPKPILETPERSWLETGDLEAEEIALEEDEGDRRGPLSLGMALSRTLPASNDAGEEGKGKAEKDGQNNADQNQRAVVVADSDFLANAHINTLSNMQLGVSLFQWLAHRDAQISVQVPPAPDSSLHLAPWEGRIIWVTFVLVVPILLLGGGLTRWWLRKRR